MVAKIYAIELRVLEMGKILKNRLSAVRVKRNAVNGNGTQLLSSRFSSTIIYQQFTKFHVLAHSVALLLFHHLQ